MNFFEQELRSLLGTRPAFKGATYVGRACIAPLGEGVRLKVEFCTTGVSGKYDALKLTVINAKEGTVDALTLYNRDYLPMLAVGGGPDTTVPHIWQNMERGHEWYPRAARTVNLKPLADAVCDYAMAFK